MEEMIREAFAPGNSVEILLRNYKVPTVGRFVGCSDGCLMLRTSRGNAIIVNVADIVRIALRPQYASENPAAEDSFIESFSPADSADNSDSVATGSENSPAEAAEGDNMESGEPRVADFIDNDLFKLPTEKPELKVVGHIDLSSIRDPRKKPAYQQDFHYQPRPRTNSRYRQSAETYPSYFYSDGIKAKGKIMRKGPAFGFIQNSDGKQVYMNCNEIVSRRGGNIPSQGDDVVFTPGSNQQGEIAKCVHLPMSIGEQLEFIEEIMGRDRRNARMLASQLQREYHDDENVMAALQSLGMAGYNQMPQRQRFDARQVLDMIARGEHVDGRMVLRAERELSDNAVYDDYKHYADTLLNYAIEEDHTICYQLLSRMIKMARANDSEDDAQDIIDQAIELYKDSNENICQYFMGLRELHPAASSEEEGDADEEETASDTENDGEMSGNEDSDSADSEKE